MPTLQISDAPRPLVIGARGLAAIEQNMRIIVRTLAYSVPLDRGFAHMGSFIDAPTPCEAARRVAELIHALEAREPRVRVLRVSLEPDPRGNMEGRLYPRIVYELRDGVQL
ncbi:GPW/gp25 family protein [Desulfovibrio sp. ZJ200]|uniref:GPW/gp25 family protein n=1 Tax=Desulfovibrio sp. ZJ200 TaxID=2709792 RepID=UPI0013EB813B|nr:GPW/gp25 family protein [Desulfovibrio sp. ZJ200]